MQLLKRSRELKFACLLILGTVCYTNLARADEKILSDHRLPKETFLHVSISNVPEFSKQFNKTAAGQLFRDKSLAEFWKEMHGKLTEKQKELEKAIGTELTELPGLAQGEVSFALCKAGPQGIAIVGFFHYGDKQELVNKLIEKAEKALAEEGVKRSEEELSDVKAIVLKKEKEKEKAKEDEEDESDDNPFDSLCYFHKDGTLVLGTDLEVLKLVLSRWDGQHERTLAKNDVYRYIIDHSRDDKQTEAPALTWYIDPVGAFTAFASAPKAPKDMKEALDFIPKVSADKVRGWGGRVEFPGAEFDTVLRSILYIDPPPGGITNLLQFDAEAQVPPKWVRSDIATYTAINWDLQKAIAGIESLMDLKSPGMMAQTLDFVAMQGPKVHPRKDFLDHLSGHFHFLTKGGDGTGAKAADARFAVALHLKDADAVKRTVTKLMAIAPPIIKTREFQGETLYEVPLPGAQLGRAKGEEDATPRSAGMVIAEGQLMLANDVTMLEQILRSKSDQEQLSESAAYKRVAKLFPAKTTAISYSKQDEQIRAAYEMLRSGMLTRGAEDAPDFSKLPEFSVLQKYFAPSGSYTIVDEHGLKSVTFSLPAASAESP